MDDASCWEGFVREARLWQAVAGCGAVGMGVNGVFYGRSEGSVRESVVDDARLCAAGVIVVGDTAVEGAVLSRV